VAVGSGQAMELGRRGDADVLLVHSPAAEQKFMEEGLGAKRLAVMHNDFVIVGPAEDSAKVKGSRLAVDAFKAIAGRQSVFISRGDDSGTHSKEREIWKAAGLEPAGDWYTSAGTGMAQALRIANEKRAYTLSDRATYLALKDELELVVLVEGDERLLNRYSVITINPGKHAHIHQREANRFADFLVSPSGQKAIGTFGVERYGQPLFFPDAAQ
jgi:tungstate transport system substrate-binding protein